MANSILAPFMNFNAVYPFLGNCVKFAKKLKPILNVIKQHGE